MKTIKLSIKTKILIFLIFFIVCSILLFYGGATKIQKAIQYEGGVSPDIFHVFQLDTLLYLTLISLMPAAWFFGLIIIILESPSLFFRLFISFVFIITALMLWSFLFLPSMCC